MARRTLPANIRIELFLPSQAVVVRGAPVELEMVILNLFTNSADAMPNGGQIRLEAASPCPRTIAITVTDDGVGMSAKVLARATDPYETTKPVGQGTGLGLAMVRAFVDKTGGTLDITSELGQGTQVKLTLPRVPYENNDGAMA
jgi:signal transduction histidine kinase